MVLSAARRRGDQLLNCVFNGGVAWSAGSGVLTVYCVLVGVWGDRHAAAAIDGDCHAAVPGRRAAPPPLYVQCDDDCTYFVTARVARRGARC